MLLTEVTNDPRTTAQKQSYVDYVADGLDKAGIKYERKGSMALDVYNGVSKTRPIYVVKATRDGVDIVDDSAARMATQSVLPGYSPDEMLAVKTVDSRNSRNKLLAVPNAKNQTVFTQDTDYKAAFNPRTGHYDLYKPKHYYTGVKKLVSARETVYLPKTDEYVFRTRFIQRRQR